jgi:hypothetical protein
LHIGSEERLEKPVLCHGLGSSRHNSWWHRAIWELEAATQLQLLKDRFLRDESTLGHHRKAA